MVQIISYGSLRKGHYNFDRFKRAYGDGFNYVRTTTITGYNIFDLGSYPGLKISSNPKDVVVVDVLEISDECFKSIEGMEHGAGYSTIKVVADDNQEKYFAYLYEYPCSDLVESGDWTLHQGLELEKA